jgi:hypothetical protein
MDRKGGIMSTIFGWDASHYDDVKSDTAERVISEGFSFYTHKAGGDADDNELAAFWAEFKGHRDKLLVGAYWVLLPGNPVGRANAFCDRLDKVCPGWGDAPFILQVDCEKWNGNPKTVPSKAEIKAFCDRLRVRAPKLMPIVYAPKWVYQDSLKGLGYPLWASAYVSGSGAASKLYPGDSSSKWGPYSGQVPAILQFTSSAKVAGQTTSDANAYRGTLDQLTNLLAPGFTVKPKPPIPPKEPDVANPTAQEIADAILNSPIGNENYPKRTVRQALNDLSNERDGLADPLVAGTDKSKIDPATPLGRMIGQFTDSPTVK